MMVIEHRKMESGSLQLSFRQLFSEHSRSLKKFLYRKSGDQQLAEDISQEAFLRLWNNRQQIPLSKAKSFLYTVANNLFLDEIRHKKVVSNYQMGIQKEYRGLAPDRLLERQEMERNMNAAIRALPEKSRTVFVMSRMDHLTYKEIAGQLNISVKAVEKRMYIALQELRKYRNAI